MTFKAELVGGPEDGKRCETSHDLPVINVISASMPPEFNKGETPPEASVPLNNITYLRTKRVTEEGWRIYICSTLKPK